MNSTGSLQEQAREILFLERGVNWPLLGVMAAYCISKLTTAFRDVETTNFESKKKKVRKKRKKKQSNLENSTQKSLKTIIIFRSMWCYYSTYIWCFRSSSQEEINENHADSYTDNFQSQESICKWKRKGELQKTQIKTLNLESSVKIV